MRMARLAALVSLMVLLFVSVPVGAQQPVAPPPPQIPYGAPISLDLAKKVNAGFRGNWVNSENNNKTEAEMIALCNKAHPTDPIAE